MTHRSSHWERKKGIHTTERKRHDPPLRDIENIDIWSLPSKKLSVGSSSKEKNQKTADSASAFRKDQVKERVGMEDELD